MDYAYQINFDHKLELNLLVKWDMDHGCSGIFINAHNYVIPTEKPRCKKFCTSDASDQIQN
jgi:hypothetical protein